MCGEELLEFLRIQRPARAPLAAVLGANPEHPCVYYLCPLSTLRQIATQGILPRASAPSVRADVSGAGVQARREGDVNLCSWRECKLHECVNFFWNPLNQTSFAFQRHALLIEQASGNVDDGIICILELELDPLVRNRTCYWAITPGNYAQFPFTTFSAKVYAGEKRNKNGELLFNWPGIFSINQVSKDPWANSQRSAEFILSILSGIFDHISAPIPFAHVGRILVPDDTVRNLTGEQQAFLSGIGCPFTRHSNTENIPIFYPATSLLDAERWLLHGLQERMAIDPAVFDKVNATIAALRDFELRHPEFSPTHEKFKHEGAAYGHHGAAHAARVMFWAAFLAQHLAETDRLRVLDALLAVAAIHDTQRQSNAADDLVHGSEAANTFEAAIKAAIPDAGVAASCLTAVAAHCRPDTECANQDVIWSILKDADALDRGRFGWPDKEGGCLTNSLRQGVLKADEKKHIAWMAFNVAKMTAYLGTETTPCANLGVAVHGGLHAYAKAAG